MKAAQTVSEKSTGPALEIVLKCDSVGSMEAVKAAIAEMTPPAADVSIIRSGVGAIGKSDVLLAQTASRLIVGFQVGVTPGIEKVLIQHGVEVRLYDVIYKLTADMKSIAESMVPYASEEQITGSAKVIALFKSSRKGIIAGCEVTEGLLQAGEHFRVISTVGPVYLGRLESLHIGEREVQKATRGQQVGIKISDFKGVRVGDIVESFRPSPSGKPKGWKPTGGIIRK